MGSSAGAFCGNGAVEENEDCDDGDAINGDGCNSDCSISGAQVWEIRSSRAAYDSFLGVTTHGDGSIFVSGSQAVNGQERLLARFAPNGDLVWSKAYEEADSGALLAVGTSGSRLYAAGMTNSDKRSVWVGGFDLDGELVWKDVVSSEFGHSYATGLSPIPDGGFVVVGLKTVDGGLAEVWTRRYGAEGSVEWTQGRPINDKALYSQGPGISFSEQRIVVGFYSEPGFAELMVAYPPSGGDPLLDVISMNSGPIYGVAEAAMGDIFVTGWETQVGISVRRYDTQGVILWSSFDCSGGAGRALAVDAQGDVVVIGDGPGSTMSNIRLCKFSPDGKLRWGKDIDGGEGNDFGRAVAILPDDRIVVAGEMYLNGDYHGWLSVYSP